MSDNNNILISNIVTAYVSNHTVALSDLPLLIQTVRASILDVEQTGMITPVQEQKPATTIRGSVKPDAVTCMNCGKAMKMLKRHLSTEHNLTIDEYRAQWHLPKDHPVVAPNYAIRRKELALKIGLGKTGSTPRRGRGKAKK